MTQDEYQINAITLFQEGEYEEAIETMAKSTTIGDEEYKKFVNQCKSCLTDQYEYLIIEAIHNGDCDAAINYRNEFLEKFGDNPRIANIEIKESVIREEAEENRTSQATAEQTPNTDNPGNSSATPKASDTVSTKVVVFSVVALAVIILIFVLSRSRNSNYNGHTYSDYPACDSTSVDPLSLEEHTSETTNYTSSVSSATDDEVLESVPDFSGEWESTNEDFMLELHIKKNSYTNDINASGGIYRLCDWELNGKTEKGKLILDDGQGSFIAEFELINGKLYGKCKAEGYNETVSFNGNLTMTRVDKDNALYKLMHNGGGTYHYSITYEEEYDYNTVTVNAGIQIALKQGPQIAVVKQWGDDSWSESGEYKIDGYSITITTDEGNRFTGVFSKDMSTLYINGDEGERIALKRTGDFEW